jgi:hypothetical protein
MATRKMKRYAEGNAVYEDDVEETYPRRGEEPVYPRDLKEMGDASAAESAGQFGDAGTSRTVKATPKAMPKATPKAMPKAAPKPAAKAESKPAPKADASDETKMSLTERMKMSRDRARSGSGATDTRSVGERLRAAFAGKNRGGNSVDFAGSGMGMKRGGKVSSASKRADGIAIRGKTRA